MKTKKQGFGFTVKYCSKKIYPKGGLNDFQAEAADRLLFFLNEEGFSMQIKQSGILNPLPY